MNTANWVPDLFMKRVMEGGDWTLFSPSTCPDLHDKFGKAFEEAYTAYEAKAARGEIKLFKTMKASDLWRKMLSMLFETGHPWITFKDACNVRSPQQHVGVVHSSNLCTEITLNTGDTEIAVCNLGSVNLAHHLAGGQLDQAKLKKTVATAMRMLDNVIDINYYAVKKARDSNLRHRPVGLGIMGFQDSLYELGVPYASEAAVDFADRSMEAVCYHAYWASTDLAAERGRYSSYHGSLWDRGILPIDSVDLLAEQRGGYVELDPQHHARLGCAAPAHRPARHAQFELRRHRADGDDLQHRRRQRVDRAVVRQPVGQVQPVRRVHDRQRVPGSRSEEARLWDDVMVMDLKHFDGSLRRIDRVPADLKALYATAFEIETQWLVEAAARRQKWIDQAQSLNIYMAGASGKKLDETYKLAWLRGLRRPTTCARWARRTPRNRPVKSGQLNAVTSGAAPVSAAAKSVAPTVAAIDDEELASDIKFCALDNPDCEACQ
jgi:ribonucleoside-diphosphate reductase alpha chain